MRELVTENQEILIIPQDFKFANRGRVTQVSAGDFTMELEYDPEAILENTYCEFYTQTPHGKLYFDSYAKEIKGKTLVIASPAKHKFLQRRQYTRIKFIHDLELISDTKTHSIKTVDISAGGMKFNTNENIDLDTTFKITIPLFDKQTLDCSFSPIRIEKNSGGGYVVSGQFVYDSGKDRMILTQFCAKRSIEIKNK